MLFGLRAVAEFQSEPHRSTVADSQCATVALLLQSKSTRTPHIMTIHRPFLARVDRVFSKVP